MVSFAFCARTSGGGNRIAHRGFSGSSGVTGRQWYMSELIKLSDLQAATEQNRDNFLKTDLALCFTFADLVKTECEMGDWEAARH